MLIVKPEIYDMTKDLIESLEKTAILPIPFWFQLLYSYIGSVIMLVSGIFILGGRNWARVILMVWLLSVLIITLLITGLTFPLYSKFIIAVIVLFLLYSKKSNRYFSSECN